MARKISYAQARERPHAGYYRHLPAGETQRNGAWTEAERRKFFERMREWRGDSDTFTGCWGTFSLGIPGRVGYQCNNFYRALLQSGEMHDSQYVIGEDGKMHHASRVHPPRESQRKKVEHQQSKPFTIDMIESLRFVKGSETRTQAVSSDLAFEEEHQISRYEMWAMQNPLPEAIDFITQEPIRVPAISPDGYVLDYKTWLESLSEKPVNPFTQRHLTKRQLVILTTENINEYAGRIVNLKLE
jgi:hypothetical protein